MSKPTVAAFKPKKVHHEVHEEADSEGTWAVSYGDMVTLLLAFFILFFSLEKPNPTADKLKLALFEDLNSTKFSAVAVEEFRKVTSESQEKDNPNGVDLKGDDPQINELRFPAEFKGVIHDLGKKMVIEFPGVSFFPSASTSLTREGKAVLKAFTKVYMPYAGHFQVGIRAYADPRPVRSDNQRFKDNLELSALRSIATMRELQMAGVPLDKMRTGGFGELITTANELAKIPEAKRTPSSVLDLSRRVVLVIEPGGER